ncbi:hypothetical protein Tco_0867939, partial [Tanacetum coccineum]
GAAAMGVVMEMVVASVGDDGGYGSSGMVMWVMMFMAWR